MQHLAEAMVPEAATSLPSVLFHASVCGDLANLATTLTGTVASL